ncbi:MAG: hypothetical protein P8P81_08980, partial [Bacteroidia bacterium]|nr:hypothetical protein [Bacteroidia bacterium]
GIMKGAYPPERQRVWVWGEYELRYIDPPRELEGYHPLWINKHFLEKAKFTNGKLVVGDASFSMLYVDVNYMDSKALNRIVELAGNGLPICLKRTPLEPSKIKSDNYSEQLIKLMKFPNVKQELNDILVTSPLLEADSLPNYWCKVDHEGNAYLFLAQWKSKNLTYPVYSGQSYMNQENYLPLTIHYNGTRHEIEVLFKPYQSVMIKISPSGKTELIDISFTPKDPIIRPREKQRTYF